MLWFLNAESLTIFRAGQRNTLSPSSMPVVVVDDDEPFSTNQPWQSTE
jgi:hypothetical protein